MATRCSAGAQSLRAAAQGRLDHGRASTEERTVALSVAGGVQRSWHRFRRLATCGPTTGSGLGAPGRRDWIAKKTGLPGLPPFARREGPAEPSTVTPLTIKTPWFARNLSRLRATYGRAALDVRRGPSSAVARRRFGTEPRLSDLTTRLQGLAVAPDRPRSGESAQLSVACLGATSAL
jgi:hypothetical protein